jgi:hypothetical protein
VDRWRPVGNLPACFCARRNLGSATQAWRGRVENGGRSRSGRRAPGPGPRSPVQSPRSGHECRDRIVTPSPLCEWGEPLRTSNPLSGHGSGPLRSPRVRSNESGRSLCPAVTYGREGSGPDTFDRKGPGTGPDSNIGTGLICRALGSSAKQRAPANRRQQSFEFQPTTKLESTIGLTPDARRSVRAPITPGEPPASAGGCFNPPHHPKSGRD